MKTHLAILILLAPLMTVMAAPQGILAAGQPGHESPPWSAAPFPLIEHSLTQGEIDGHLAAVYRYFALFEPERLPARFAADAGPVVRCATGIRLAAIDAARYVAASIGPVPGPGRGAADLVTRDPEYFVDSELFPIRVHWNVQADEEEAMNALAYAEQAWDVQVNELGFSPPPSDNGAWGGDERYDIHLERGAGMGYTVEIAPVPDTWWDDWSTYIGIDPLVYGGVWLESTVAHELNHAMQAADDWW